MSTAQQAATPRGGVWEKLRQRRDDIFRRPYFDYLNIMIVVLLLVALGIVMVMSASMSRSLFDGGGVWNTTIRQMAMVVIGFFGMWLAMRLPIYVIRKFSTVILIVSILLLMAVFIPGVGTGLAEKGSQSWIVIGPLNLQPSEIARVAIAMWGASVLSGHKPKFVMGDTPYVRFAGVSLLMFLLILAERDLGMALAFLFVVFTLAFFAGVSRRFIATACVIAFVGFVAMVSAVGFRSDRMAVYREVLFGRFEDSKNTAFQSYQGFLSLADGSLTGVGIGQSRAKWFYLPEAKNDFIFAIIGEELGLVGGVLVIALFAWLGCIGFRIAARSSNQYLALLSATLTAAVVGQAAINMGYVVGLLPVTGIQLPLISYGGTSAVITLTAMGLVASCARHEPETVSAMANYGKPTFDNVLRLPEPRIDTIDKFRQLPVFRWPHRRSVKRGSVNRDDPRNRRVADHPARRPVTGRSRRSPREQQPPHPNATGGYPSGARTDAPRPRFESGNSSRRYRDHR